MSRNEILVVSTPVNPWTLQLKMERLKNRKKVLTTHANHIFGAAKLDWERSSGQLFLILF